MTRRIDQVQLVRLAILGLVQHRHRVGLDGDAALLLEVHRVKQLVFHLARRDRAGPVQQPIGKCRLAVIDVGDDAEISNVRYVHRLKPELRAIKSWPNGRKYTLPAQMPNLS